MAKEICISTTPHETRLAILEDDQLAEIYYERENEYTLAGSIYKGRVTRVLPGMQSSFVDLGLERDAFLYVTDFLEEQEDGEEYDTSGGSRRSSEENTGEERRGRRDRGNRDGRRPEKTEAAAAPAAPREPKPVREAAPAADAEQAEDGETPQGTRRWRGRRGRRRGGVRAGALAPGAEQSNTTEVEEISIESSSVDFSSVDSSAVDFALPEHGAPGGLIAAHPPESGSHEPAPHASFDLQAASEGRPRSSSSSSSRSSVLPGEQIVKYGGKPTVDAAPTAKAQVLPQRPVNYVAPKPTTLVEVGEGYDGGFVLPGESIARHRAGSRPVAAAPEAASEVALEAPSPVANDEPAQHDATTHPVLETEVPAQETLEAAHEALVIDAEPSEHVVSQPQSAVPDEEFTQLDDPEVLDKAGASETSSAIEHEPKEGDAASHNVPPATSELRFSQLFGGGDKREPQPVVQDEEPSESPRSTVEAGTEFAPQGFAHEAAVGDPEAGDHQRSGTATHEAGEPAGDGQINAEDRADYALSPEFGDRFADEPEAEHVSEPVHAGEALAHSAETRADRFTELVDQLHGYAPGFAPGAGHLEEEVIDEDEYDFDPIHAHADEHDLEDLEEETLQGDETGTEIGSLELQMEESGFREDETAFEDDAEEHEAGTLAFEAVDEDEEGEPAVSGEPSKQREGGERGRRGNGRNRRGARNSGGGGGRRQSAQTQDLPIISDLLKAGQEILVQIAKEPIAKKGARITSHIALPGRFLVFMPTVHHVGVSRKIASDEERQRLKRILTSEKGESSGGFIVRTAADGASEDELRADLRFLINLWTEIKQRADTAKAPALIYHDLNLVERILRDQVSANFSTIWVDTEQEYERIVRFLNRFQPSLVRRVKLYTKETPLFEHFGITEEISKALKSKVWLKSGGSIVINQTEALVAIDINTGKYVGKTARLEDTIVKTNLDAIPEIVRQIRLRDLGGIIVIDFIDMDERKNRQKVLTALEEALKADRAPSKVLQFNDFGLVAITRKRVKQSLERTLSVQCNICAGTGMVKSPITVCNEIYIELRKMTKHLDGKDVMLRVNPEVVKQLKSGNGRWISEYEEMVGKTIIIKSDPSLHPEQFDIH